VRILLIEDDPVFAEYLKHSLIVKNYAVDVVHTGQDGLDYAQTPGKIYDLMLIDVGLPGLDGITLCQNYGRGKTPRQFSL
jgi:two-component system, OmpR family, response regulator ArlR